MKPCLKIVDECDIFLDALINNESASIEESVWDGEDEIFHRGCNQSE